VEVIALERETLQLLVSMHRIVRYLRRSRSSVLHPTQFLALMLVADEQPIRIGEIATRVPCSQPTATTTVAALEEAGRQAADELTKLLHRLDPDERIKVLEAGELLDRIARDL
jgi:DNA-binding MarR family transcriptional regulator